MRTAPAITLLILSLLAFPAVVSAEGPTPGGAYGSGDNKQDTATVVVASSPSGVIIYIGLFGTTDGQAGSPGSTDVVYQPGEQPVCTTTPNNLPWSSVQSAWYREGSAANPGSMPWSIYCDNGYWQMVWIPFDTPGMPVVVVTDDIPGVDPAAYAASLADLIPLPPIAVEANPSAGMVALESWFWMVGYGGQPLREARALGLTVVEVEIVPTSYRWLFGDGATMTTATPGRPYPQQSEVRHVYQRSSLGAGGAYEVVLEITFAAQYRVDGGAWIPLPPMVRGWSQPYAVQELQASLGG